MKLRELQAALIEHDVRRDLFSLNRVGADEEQYRLERRGIAWVTYYYERGNEVGLRTFYDEEQACDYFLTWLLADPTTRISR
jgi:hypothetical protein